MLCLLSLKFMNDQSTHGEFLLYHQKSSSSENRSRTESMYTCHDQPSNTKIDASGKDNCCINDGIRTPSLASVAVNSFGFQIEEDSAL